VLFSLEIWQLVATINDFADNQVQISCSFQGRPKTGQLIVWFSVIFLTGQIAKKPDCPVKNQTPGNPTH